jgi:hypothetical protein
VQQQDTLNDHAAIHRLAHAIDAWRGGGQGLHIQPALGPCFVRGLRLVTHINHAGRALGVEMS